MHERFCRTHSVNHFEAHHATKPVKQSLSSLVLRIAWESWIVDFGNCSVSLQEAGDLHGVLIVLSDTERQSLHSSVQEKCCVRVQAASQVIEAMSNLLNQSLLSNHGSSDDVGVAVQILCCTMDG